MTSMQTELECSYCKATCAPAIGEGVNMESVVGIFRSVDDAARALSELKVSGIGKDQVTVLCPGTLQPEVEKVVPTTDAEPPGIGEALGGTVGGAIGAAAGATLGLAAASLFLPGVGPVIAAGVIGAAIAGAGGVLVGVSVGEFLEHELGNDLPKDELFVYEDALRKGRTVMIVRAADNDS